MNGSQGLEALATLCGGASKAPDNEPPQQQHQQHQLIASKQTTQPNQINGSNSAGTQSQQVPLAHQLDQFGNPQNAYNIPNNDANSNQTKQNQMLAHQMNPQVAALLNAGLAQQNITNNAATNEKAMALRQMVFLNLLHNQNNVSSMLNQQAQPQPPANQFVDQNALAMVLALQQQQAQHEVASNHQFQSTPIQQQQQQHEPQQQQPQPQQQQQQSQQQQHEPQQQQQQQFMAIIPPASQQNISPNLTNTNSNTIENSFQAPLPKVKIEVPIVSCSSGTPIHQPILMRKPQGESSELNSPSTIHSDIPKAVPPGRQDDDDSRDRVDSLMFPPEDKKLLKRAANRRSAQLSRKRKKQYIEDLKDENTDLRRMELILRSIPDLVVSFDSSGKIGFVSQSVGKFLSMTPEELEGKSFWDRLCEDSVRLLKAAFMDALAARENESTTTPLGAGVWELRLQDKNKENIMVTLNGVVHFTGDAPECVCSIRLCDGKTANSKIFNQPNAPKSIKPVILPQQSVFSNGSGLPSTHRYHAPTAPPAQSARNPRISAQISDVDSTSASD